MTDPKTETKWVLDPKPASIEEWRNVMGTLPHESFGERDPSTPIVFISAIEADEYARRIGGRLPTDEELERAFRQRAVARICPAGWEWTSTADGSGRVVRGGSWDDVNADNLSASGRARSNPEYRGGYIGLRCARSAKGQQEEPMTKKPCTDPDKMLGACDQNPFLGATEGQWRQTCVDTNDAKLAVEEGTMTKTAYRWRTAGSLVPGDRVCLEQGDFPQDTVYEVLEPTRAQHVSLRNLTEGSILPIDPGRRVRFAEPDDAATLRRAAEIIGRVRRAHCALATELESEAVRLETLTAPKTFKTTWTNADPRPFTGSPVVRHASKDPSLVGVMRYWGQSVALCWVDGTEGVVDPDEPWPDDLYWTRLPEVDDE